MIITWKENTLQNNSLQQHDKTEHGPSQYGLWLSETKLSRYHNSEKPTFNWNKREKLKNEFKKPRQR